MLGPEDLVLCSGTLLNASLRELIEAASAAGFRGISLWVDKVEGAHAEGLSSADIRFLLADHGLEVAELDPLLSWLTSGSDDADPDAGAEALLGRSLGRSEAEFYEIAESIGGRLINCAHPLPGAVDLDQAAEAFAGVCKRAAEHGLDAAIEFLPWTGIPDVATASTIVERAGCDNGGILFDTWHHFRSSNDDAALSIIPGTEVAGVQINSAPREPHGDAMLETLHERLLPDQPDIAVAHLVGLLDAIGSRAPIGVEVFSDELNALPPTEAAQRCADAARRVLSAARGDG